ncbi:hypothetical protein Nepgr_016032 [Nepenthes gracilis]|uniref:Cytochrome P450 n=1 Tax=Nepenthes gracilis TaxID=150966 RepID=A0AAD3XRV6_NEPGR|nr:hypothetical protein Nepgr_016032 [Nepenthes gracilis]
MATSIGAGMAVFVVMILTMTWLWRVVKWIWLRPKTLERCLRQQGFAGNSYRLLFGDLKDFFRSMVEARSQPISFTNDYLSRADPFVYQTIKNYGKNSFAWMGPIPMVNIAEPELIKEVFSKISDFQKPKFNKFFQLLIPGLAQYEGEKWAKHRKMINPAFHNDKLKLMLPAFCISCEDMIGKWEKIVSKLGSQEVDVMPYIITLSADVISRSAFGSSYEEGRKIFQLIKEQIDIAFQGFQIAFIPGWRFLPTRTNRRLRQLDHEIQTLLKGIIYKRKEAMEIGEDAKDDLLGILMQSSLGNVQKHGSDIHHLRLTINEVIDECKLFYLAGQETTSMLLVWTLIMLSKHQDWQARAREEVLRTFGHNKPSFGELNHLKIITMILYEVLRLYPPVIATLRSVQNDTKLGKLFLPAGVLLNLAIVISHQDDEIWGNDAKEFKPERFSKGIFKAIEGNISFFPFGWGPRICIGQNFAMFEAKIAMAMILQRFSFDLSPTYAHAPTTSMILQPQFGAHIILHGL